MTNALISIVLALLAFHRAPDFRSAPAGFREHLPSLSSRTSQRLFVVLYSVSADDSNDARKGNDPKKNDPPRDPHPKPPPPPPPHKPPPPSCHRDDDCNQEGGPSLVWTAGSWPERQNETIPGTLRRQRQALALNGSS